MSKPLVSVIIPVFNREKFIKEAVYSILNQTIQDFEILIVDDCSIDDSLSIIENLKDERIKIFKNKQHRGVSISRNIALKASRGKYIAFMDSDDISSPERLEKQITFLEENPDVNACGCWLQCFGDQQHVIKHHAKHERIQATLLLYNSMSLGATTIVKDCYKSYLFNPDKIHVEDYDYWVQSAWSCKMANLQEVLYHYRTHKKQVSTEFLNIQREQDIEIRLQLFKKINVDLVDKYKNEIIRVLFLNKAQTKRDYKLFFRFLRRLLKINRKSKVYDQNELERVIKKINSKVIFELFFLNRNNLSLYKRLAVLPLLSWNDRYEILRQKVCKKNYSN